jgi:hypothetical protein
MNMVLIELRTMQTPKPDHPILNDPGLFTNH